MTVRRLGDDVERALALGNFAPPPLAPSAKEIDLDARPAGLQTGAIPHLQKENERLFFRTVPEVAQLFRAVLATEQRRIERIRGRPCRASDALEAMLDHALATWRPKKRTRRDYVVFERDGLRFELGLRVGRPAARRLPLGGGARDAWWRRASLTPQALCAAW